MPKKQQPGNRISHSRVARHAKKLVSELLKAGIQSDLPSLPKDFGQWDPQLLADTVVSSARESGKKITMFGWTAPDLYGPILEKLAQARTHLLGSECDDLFSALSLSMDYRLLGGDTFVPSIMPNGSVLIRDQCEIIGFETNPSLIINSTPSELKHELVSCRKKQATCLEPPKGLSVLHRCKDGRVAWLSRMPRDLSDVGQSVVLLGPDFDLSLSRVLSSSQLMEIREQSLPGLVGLRTFGAFTTVHRGMRVADDYDALLEEFAQAYLDEVDIPRDLSANQQESSLRRIFHDRSLELYASSGMPTLFADPCRYYVEKLVGADDPRGWGTTKLKQCLQLLPIFARAPDLPATPDFLLAPYHHATKAGLWAVIEFNCAAPDQVGSALETLKSAVWFAKSERKKLKRAKIIITATHASQLDWLLTDKPPRGDASTKKIGTALNEWLRDAESHAPASNTTAPLQICILKQTQEPPSIESTLEWTKYCSNVTGSLVVTVTMPSLGLRQTYRNGRSREGNAQAFIPLHPHP